MMLGVTHQLCQEVAVVPLLWVLPLAIYLVSFIICFDRPQAYRRRFYIPAAGIASFVILITSYQGVRLAVLWHILFNGLFLFLFCMTIHGELVKLRPKPKYLTGYYLTVSAGGALGGFFISVLAPLYLAGLWEYHIALGIGWVLIAARMIRDRSTAWFDGDAWYLHLFIAVALYAAIRLSIFMGALRHSPTYYSNILEISLAVGMLAGVASRLLLHKHRFSLSPIWPRLYLGLVLFAVSLFLVMKVRSDLGNRISGERNFFGTVRISAAKAKKSKPPYLCLSHGNILHGTQITEAGRIMEPTSYYGKNSGLAHAINYHPRQVAGETMHIGVLGMGVGTVAAWGKTGDQIRFYEINPAVIHYAASKTKPIFQFIQRSPAEITVVPGDARLSMDREFNKGQVLNFDILVLDAFTSDAIPAHLITQEALALYRKHLRGPESMIAINISNRFLDLRDLMHSLAAAEGLHCALFPSKGRTEGLETSSLWVIMSEFDAFFELPNIQDAASDYESSREIIWTDRFSSLMPLFK